MTEIQIADPHYKCVYMCVVFQQNTMRPSKVREQGFNNSSEGRRLLNCSLLHKKAKALLGGETCKPGCVCACVPRRIGRKEKTEGGRMKQRTKY